VQREEKERQEASGQASSCSSSSSSKSPAAASHEGIEEARGPALRAAKPATQAAEPAFLHGVVAVVAVLHDLADSGQVQELCCSVTDMRLLETKPDPDKPVNFEALLDSNPDPLGCTSLAAYTAETLWYALAAFQCWDEGALEPAAISWVPVDAAAALAAIEACIRLAPKLQYHPGLHPSGLDLKPRKLLWIVTRWLPGLELAAAQHARSVQSGAVPRVPSHYRGCRQYPSDCLTGQSSPAANHPHSLQHHQADPRGTQNVCHTAAAGVRDRTATACLRGNVANSHHSGRVLAGDGSCHSRGSARGHLQVSVSQVPCLAYLTLRCCSVFAERC